MVMGELEQETELLVIGGGPGGYAAAFRAADLGSDVTLVEVNQRPGGVCLFRGCIPSKALLQASELLHDSRNAAAMGIRFASPQIDIDALRQWKNHIVEEFSTGLETLTRKRGIQYLQGRATFEGPHTVRLADSEVSHIRFKHAVVATGSQPMAFPGETLASGKRIMTSTEALKLMDVPPRLLVIGGGYIGLELGSVYAALGSRVTVVELGDRLLAGVDPDLVRILAKRLESAFESIEFNTRVLKLTEEDTRVRAEMETSDTKAEYDFDRVLVAIGRRPRTEDLGLDKAGIETDPSGFIPVDDHQRTANPDIFAIGDVVRGAMLAHRAVHQGKIVAEIIRGQPSAYDVRAMPAVVFTDPQLAWAGKTEEDARREGLDVEIRRFPWKYSGRAAIIGQQDGMTKMIVDKKSRRIVGVGIVGRHAEDLIAEAVLAIEMGALADDVALSVHPHPTLSETQAEAAEIFLGSATHILSSRTSR